MTSYGEWVKEGEEELARMGDPTEEEKREMLLELDRENAEQAEREEAELAARLAGGKMIGRVTLDDLFPRAGVDDEPLAGVVRFGTGGPCWVCGRHARWASLSFQAWVCSMVCDDLGWLRFWRAEARATPATPASGSHSGMVAPAPDRIHVHARAPHQERTGPRDAPAHPHPAGETDF